jgi:predicted nucleic acid-binding protein
MCVIVDANCFGSVFNPSAKHHKKFSPVYEWLLNQKGGRLIYGGTKYKKEIDFTNEQNRRLLLEIQRKGRLVHLNDAKVDKRAIEVKQIEKDKDFDDEHIVAIVGISKCCVVCTFDARSDRFLKRANLYPKGVKPPKIYRNARNKKLCGCEKHIAEICNEEKKAKGK